jgi:hypothetical protein
MTHADLIATVGRTPLVELRRLAKDLAIAARQDAAGKIIVVILADTGERYITTSLFSAGAEQPQR